VLAAACCWGTPGSPRTLHHRNIRNILYKKPNIKQMLQEIAYIKKLLGFLFPNHPVLLE
jgi:hypothetical protein